MRISILIKLIAGMGVPFALLIWLLIRSQGGIQDIRHETDQTSNVSAQLQSAQDLAHDRMQTLDNLRIENTQLQNVYNNLQRANSDFKNNIARIAATLLENKTFNYTTTLNIEMMNWASDTNTISWATEDSTTNQIIHKLTDKVQQFDAKIQDTISLWSISHPELGKQVQLTQRGYLYWSMRVANVIFIRSAVGELIPEDPEDTRLHIFFSTIEKLKVKLQAMNY